jgi:RNA polymerase sigma-70 factor (ECF subfamily)
MSGVTRIAVNGENDRDLIIQLKNGSLEALGDLYDRHRWLVYRTALGITGDQDAAADLLQDVFLRLHRFSGRLDPQLPIEPWLYRMTTNLAYSWMKNKRHWYQPLEDLADWLIGKTDASPAEIIEKNDEWVQVQQALTQLPLAQRIVVVLYYLDDLSMQEIAETLNVPVGTVKSRLHYGRRELKKKLGLAGKQIPGLKFDQT